MSTQNNDHVNNIKGMLLTLIAVLAWAFTGVGCQYLFTYNAANPAFMTASRMLISGTILLIASLKQNIFLLFEDTRDIFRLLVFSVAGLLLAQYSFSSAVRDTDAGTATILQFTAPVMILGFVCLKYHRRPLLNEVIAIILAIAGVVLLSTNGDFTKLDISLRGLIWGLLSGVGLGIYSLLIGPLSAKYGSFPVIGWGMVVAGTVMSLVPGTYETTLIWNLPGTLNFLAFVFIGTTFAYTAYLIGVTMIGAFKTSLITAAEPVGASILSALWLGTRFSSWDITGFALVIATVFVLSYQDIRKSLQHRA